MELGFVGLGRMGGNMVTRLARGGHRIVAWDRAADAAARARDNGTGRPVTVDDYDSWPARSPSCPKRSSRRGRCG